MSKPKKNKVKFNIIGKKNLHNTKKNFNNNKRMLWNFKSTKLI